jgi:peptidoglycan/xylan/chitin deacetylase (PgdA/CDA1 family)
MHPETFESLVKYCRRNYEIISFSDIHKKSKKPKLILSFDDGYYDFIEYALPVLKQYGVPANHNLVNICLNGSDIIWTQKMNAIFNFLKDHSVIDDDIVTEYANTFKSNNNDWLSCYNTFFESLLKLSMNERSGILNNLTDKYGIETKCKMMDWHDAKICTEKHNIEIGCHTYNHDSLSVLCDDGAFETEIGNSIREMELKLNKKIKTLALPNGKYNNKAIDYCKTAGLKNILLLSDKVNRPVKLNDQFNLINRIYMVNETIEAAILRMELFHSIIKKIA